MCHVHVPSSSQDSAWNNSLAGDITVWRDNADVICRSCCEQSGTTYDGHGAVKDKWTRPLQEALLLTPGHDTDSRAQGKKGPEGLGEARRPEASGFTDHSDQ